MSEHLERILNEPVQALDECIAGELKDITVIDMPPVRDDSLSLGLEEKC